MELSMTFETWCDLTISPPPPLLRHAIRLFIQLGTGQGKEVKTVKTKVKTVKTSYKSFFAFIR